MTSYSIALINPNSSLATTEMMKQLAEKYLPAEYSLQTFTASTTPEMLVSPEHIDLAQKEVLRLGLQVADAADAIIIAAFGDPGLKMLRAAVGIPVIGIGEASLLMANHRQRPFAVATVTPSLKNEILSYIAGLGLLGECRGVFITEAEPDELLNNAELQDKQLFQACLTAIEKGAEAIVIGGGPLAQSAERLKTRLPVLVISPLVAGVNEAIKQIQILQG